MDILDTGAERRVSRVLSIFSVEIAVIIICAAISSRKNTTKGAIMDWDIRTAVSASGEICAVLPFDTVNSTV